MLSILIPTYQYNVSQLVENLHAQALQLTIEFEILLYDDASGEEWEEIHSEVAQLPFVHYKMLALNKGRSAIRNLLAEDANYSLLLYLDGDSSIASDSYLEDMLRKSTGRNAVVGRTVYTQAPPKDRQKRLRWNYGSKREDILAVIRQQNPYHSFKTHHFLIPKSILLMIRFDESIKDYGHEDTLFGAELQKLGVQITHTDAPLFHDGLEDIDIFLNKTKMGVKNLLKLNKTEPRVNSKLWKTFTILQNPLLRPLMNLFSLPLMKFTESLLRNKYTNIRLLDLYKLCLIHSLSKQNQTKH